MKAEEIFNQQLETDSNRLVVPKHKREYSYEQLIEFANHCLDQQNKEICAKIAQVQKEKKELREAKELIKKDTSKAYQEAIDNMSLVRWIEVQLELNEIERKHINQLQKEKEELEKIAKKCLEWFDDGTPYEVEVFENLRELLNK